MESKIMKSSTPYFDYQKWGVDLSKHRKPAAIIKVNKKGKSRVIGHE